MTDARKAELVALLLELSQQYPDWRFGQMVANVADWADQNVWDVDDEALLEAAREHLHRAASIPSPSRG